jgi:ankyrin repeat protein
MKHGDWTPVMIAAHKGLLEEVQLLLRYGADANLKNSAGFTAFHLACQCDHNDAVCLYLANVSDIHTRANNQRSALFTAVKHGNVETVKLILKSSPPEQVQTNEHGVSIFENAREGPGDTMEEMMTILSALQNK